MDELRNTERPRTFPQKPHVARLDVLRALAALCVFLLHYYGAAFAMDNFVWNGLWRDLNSGPDRLFYLLYPLSYGWIGVPLFFVISGFVIHLSFLKSSQFQVRAFYWRRLWRIYPPYLLALIVVTLLQLKALPRAQIGFQLITHLFLVHNFDRVTFYGIDPVFWSLATEFQLYLLYPILLQLRQRIGIEKALWITFGISMAGRLVAALTCNWNRDLLSVVWESTLFLWFDWSLGAYLAERFHKGKPVLAIPNFGIFCCVAALLLAPFFKPTSALNFTIGSLNAAILVDRTIRWQKPLSRFEIALVPLGLCSYSFYLWHHPIIPRCFTLGHRLHLPETYLMKFLFYPIPIFLLALGVSWLTYRTVELWSMAQGRKYSGSASAKPL